eukprot:s1472_g15.t1
MLAEGKMPTKATKSPVVADETEGSQLLDANVSFILGPWHPQVQSFLPTLGTHSDVVALGTVTADAGAANYFNLYALHAELVLSTLLRTWESLRSSS